MAKQATESRDPSYNPLTKVSVAGLRRSYSYPSGGPSYGPSDGAINVPRGLADSLGLPTGPELKAAEEPATAATAAKAPKAKAAKSKKR